MTNSNTINIDGIGPVLFEKSRRAKRVIISIRTSRGVRVAVPTQTSFKKALEFVYVKKQWIQKHLGKKEQDENKKKAFTDRFHVIDKADAKKKLTDRLFHLANNMALLIIKYLSGNKEHAGEAALRKTTLA